MDAGGRRRIHGMVRVQGSAHQPSDHAFGQSRYPGRLRRHLGVPPRRRASIALVYVSVRLLLRAEGRPRRVGFSDSARRGAQRRDLGLRQILGGLAPGSLQSVLVRRSAEHQWCQSRRGRRRVQDLRQLCRLRRRLALGAARRDAMRTPFLWTGALAAALAVGLASCGEIDPLNAPQPKPGNATFSTYASMGTSITAGTESGGLVVHHQVHSYAALFARQAGASAFTEPTVSADGLPPLLQIVSLSPLLISNQGRTPGTPTNLAQPTTYHNMGVPGAILFDAADSTFYYGGLPGRTSAAFDLVVRRRPGSILRQVAQLSPTFVSLEYGANEVLGPATR